MTTHPDDALFDDLMRFKPEGMTPNAWAVRAGVSRTVWSDLRRHGNPARRTLNKLLRAAGSSLAEFEALRVGHRPTESSAQRADGVAEAGAAGWRGAPLAPIPVVASAMAGEWRPGSQVEQMTVDRDEIVDWIERPTSLAGDADAYAVAIVGDAMWPRFRPGRRVYVSPRAPIAIGDDVLVLLAAPPDSDGPRPVAALLKEIVRRSAATTELRQFNPDRRIEMVTARIGAIHKVVGEAF